MSSINDERNEEIFQKLPPLDSEEYLKYLKAAPAEELPAPVLVRAYRQLPPGPAADATLARLVGNNRNYGYLRPLWAAARRKIKRDDAYSYDDLVFNTIGEVVLTLGGPHGEGAAENWVNYLLQRMEDAYRRMTTRSKRRGRRADPVVDEETGEERELFEAIEVPRGPYQGNVRGSDLEWLEGFIRRTFAKIPDERRREVAFDLFSAHRTPVSSENPNDPNTLVGRYKVRRQTIYGWQRAARALLWAALESQNERPDFEMSRLKKPEGAGEGETKKKQERPKHQ